MKKIIVGILAISSSFLIMFTFTTGAGLNKKVSAQNNNGFVESDIEYNKDIQDEVLQEVGYKLYKEGYSFGMEYEISPNKKVEIEINSVDKEATEKIKNEMKQIAMEVIKDTKYEPELFKINVTDNSNAERSGK
ncbi:hypothetical protein MUO14_23655 [Halobacillus shinanisalinarum]|uniref:Uncharacterized protein n=1 Tax=Halobacillus shinanisalinarum TaxID=2932258 RepID=A0ABY4GZJ5_9BACI|nr:hypothetical protein [Halobacillus shinanisalinarum]UOQ93333.1 hypothetical protein MUO14_23655 [Halobacillus shinanisalinarum]